jgi:ribosome biogenesis GTPase
VIDVALMALGYNDDFAAALEDRGIPGRVARLDRGACLVLTAAGLVSATMDRRVDVAAGDWVAVADGAVVAVAPRRNAITRSDPSGGGAPQVLAVNIDLVFVVCGLDRPLRPGRLERSVVLAWASGAEPVLVLTKADLAADPERAAGEAAGMVPGVTVHVTSATTGFGIDDLDRLLAGHRTAALLGESGAGKSTLANYMAGSEVLATAPVRKGDAKGRHTTTARHLVPLPGGGVLLDTPGLRGLGLWSGEDGMAAAFADIEALAAACRFADCAHGTEPGCAVTAAIEAGDLPARRLAGFAKLTRELEHQTGVISERERRGRGRQSQRTYRAAIEAKRQGR